MFEFIGKFIVEFDFALTMAAASFLFFLEGLTGLIYKVARTVSVLKIKRYSGQRGPIGKRLKN